MSHENLIGKYIHLAAKPENFTPPTKDPKDCVCGAEGDPTAGRRLIANCPCCDGVQILVEEICDCPPGTHKMRVVLPPNSNMRIRYIKAVEGVS